MTGMPHRALRPGRLGGLLLLIAAAVALSSAPAAAASGAKYYFDYKGSYSSSYTDIGETLSFTDAESLSWDVKIYADESAKVLESSLVAQGTDSLSGSSGYTCTFHQSASPDFYGYTIGPADSPETAFVTFHIPDGIEPNGQLTASGAMPGGSCAEVLAGSASTGLEPDGSEYNACYSFLASPTFEPWHTLSNVKADGYTQTYDATQALTVPPGCSGNATLTGTRTIDATITVGHGAPPVTTPNTTTPSKWQQWRREVKEAALPELRKHFTQALYPCLVATSGGVLATSGFLMTFSPGAAVASGLLAGAGAGMVFLAGPTCERLYTTIVDETQTVNDPPIGHFEELAPVAAVHASTAGGSCTTYTGKPRMLCKQVAAAYQKLEEKLGAVESIAAAIKTTIGRLSAAIAANKSSAVKKQHEYAVKLERQLKTAKEAQSKASAAVAAVFHRNHIQINLTAANEEAAIAAIEGKLATKGVSSRELAQALGTSPTPAALEEISELAHPYA